MSCARKKTSRLIIIAVGRQSIDRDLLQVQTKDALVTVMM